MKTNKKFLIILFGVLSLLVSCNDEPVINGLKTFIVGQHVTVTIDKGSNFTNQFVLKDGAGNTFTTADQNLDYEFINNTQIAFRVPSGITTGPSVLEIGYSGGTYRLNINLKRTVIYSEGKGIVKLADIENGKNILRTAECGQGYSRLKIVDDESSLVVLSANDGNIYWYNMNSSSTDKNKLSLVMPVLAIQSGTQGVNAVLKDVIAQPQGLIIATDNGIATLLINRTNDSGTQVSFGQWIDSTADYVSIDASEPTGDSNTQTIAGVGGTTDGESILTVFYTPPFPDSNSSKLIFLLSDESPSVSKVSVSQNGTYAAALIPNLNKIYLLRIEQNAQPVASEVCSNPINMDFVDSDQRIAVLCKDTNTIELYNVTGTTAELFKSIDVGSDTDKVQYMYVTKNNLVYILTDQGLKYFDASSSNPSVSTIPGFEGLSVSTFVVQP